MPWSMRPTVGTNDQVTGIDGFELSPEQQRYFETFGFLALPRLFEREVDDLAAGFEGVFENETNERMETYYPIHGNQRRVTIPSVVDKDPRLQWLRTDERVLGIARSLIGEPFEYADSDGSLFYCGTAWHADIYRAPWHQYHIKLYFYLDPLSRENGAIRMIPGTNHSSETFATRLRADLEDPERTEALYGVEGSELPSFALETNPGDLLLGNYKTLHASFGGVERRRMFTMSFRAPPTA
jgi:hypothetical protein